ncbi:uncharacterized protein LOC134287612 [Aedes albopictus]|uniref:Uncharacterized protein n=1 Tax=Aedes albopictus TaxID=7160 RepID=A0ABM1Z9R7_AEDAL
MPSRGVTKSGAKSDKGARPKARPVSGHSAGGGGNGDIPEVMIMEDTVEECITCKTCQGPDTEDMVQCDRCDGWYHFSCVGVSEEVADKSWSCTNCVTANWIQRTKTALEESARHGDENYDRKSTRSQPVVNIATSTRVNPVIPPTSIFQKPTSSEQAPAYSGGGHTVVPDGMAEQAKFEQQKQQPSLPAGGIDTRKVAPLQETEKALSEISISSSQKSAVQRAKLQLMRLEEERQFQQQQEERRRAAEERAAQEHREYLERKYRLLEEVVSEKGSRSEVSSRVNDWVQEASQVHRTVMSEVDGSNVGHVQAPRSGIEPAQASGQFEQPRIRFEPSAKTGPFNTQVDQRSGNCRKIQQSHNEFASHLRQTERARPMHFPGQQIGISSRCPQPSFVAEPATFNVNGRAISQQPANSILRPPFNSTPFDAQVSAPPACSTGFHSMNPRNSVCASQQASNHGMYDDEFQLSRSQVAARQAVPRDLPTFAGNPEEWPIFLSMYNRTTTMCGFTEEENLVRLQKSLKGKAYEAVKSRLMFPGNVSGVLSTLKMLFGQPEVIIQSLIEKVSSLPAIREDKLDTLVDFAVHVQNFCATVDACGLQEYMYNVSLLHQLVSKLPSSLKLNWAQHRLTEPTANLATFSSWIYALAEAASIVTFPPPVQYDKLSRNETHGSKKGNVYLNAHSEASEESHNASPEEYVEPVPAKHVCPICKSTCKSVDKCERFAELSRESRWAAIREFGLCRTCLRMHKGNCNAKPCGKNGCTYRHHELLHNDSKEKRNTAAAVAPKNESKPSVPPCPNPSGCNTHQVAVSSALFRYLPVVLYGKTAVINTHAFLDEGSELTLLDQELADLLELDGAERPLCLRWTGGTERCEPDSRAYNLQIAGAKERSKRFDINDVRTVKELKLPSQTLDMSKLSQEYSHLRDLPIDSYQDVRPRILIGTKHAHLGLVLKSREGEFGQPIAVKSRLGWTICGGQGSNRGANLHHYSFHICPCNIEADKDLHQAMKDYFSLDSLGVIKPDKLLLSGEDERALTLLQSLTHRRGDRYESGLLWRYDDTRLPDSRSMALQRFQCLKKRMVKEPELQTTLQGKIEEYLAKGYIRMLSDEEVTQKVPHRWYLPVFPVTNPNKPGKIRIVWDAAACAHGTSLNSALLKGPDLLCSLFTILLQFRERRIGLTGDIREMFHQVLIRAEDQFSQCFYWMNERGETEVYAMQVMTFGACCSPTTAQFVKNTNADCFACDYPAAHQAITKSHYVDDMLVSVDTEEQAIQLAKDVRHVHQQGGFEIRNWISNSRMVLAALQGVNTDEKCLDLSSELATEKVLGMWWNTTDDVFTYKVGWNRYDPALLGGERRPTKREVLRVLMTIFDPLGLISHFLSYLKILLQQIWRSGVQWDDEIDDEAYDKWLTWLKVLPRVEHVEIPRCYNSEYLTSEADEVQLHTMVDASENGTAAVCYLRFVHEGSASCSIVAAKCRVAPLKFTSIPRLELEAAVVGARLSNTIQKALSFKIHRKLYWSDSRDVLCWINSDHRRYSQYVGHRISEILETSEMDEWRWVPGKQNPADDATKWSTLPELTSKDRWFKGADFLWLPEEDWPQPRNRKDSTENELRPSLLVHHAASSKPVLRSEDFSSWERLRRVVAYVHRFADNCRHRFRRLPTATGPLTAKQLLTAEHSLIRLCQQECYADEIATLQNSHQHPEKTTSLPKSSSLYQLTPWLDCNGIMRMRGRIAACHYATEDAKYPIILPQKHHTTSLIVGYYHRKHHHLNHETVINEIRQKFRIPHLRACYQQVRKACQMCKNNFAAPMPPYMADLPPARLEAFSRPFTHTGIDYFGPIEVTVGRRVEKRWGMLATCLTVRAIHIEVVNTLSTSSCIMALRNFMARRGTPRKIYSDRGTNFVGANRELLEMHEVIKQDNFMQEFSNAGIEWIFNPPLAPHMGGSWERLIRTVKNNLVMVCPSPRPSDEILRNLLTEVESIVNSRPLTHVPIDEDSAPALTPNHFLLGSSNGSKPLTNLDGSSAALRQNWLTSQILANQYWKRWVSDYLPEITRRSKWFQRQNPIAVGDIAVIADPKMPRNCWPKGKVIGVKISSDGQVRSATVRTASGVYERPATKLAILDVRCDKN